MAIIRRYISRFMVDDNVIIVDTALNGSTVKSVIARGGSENTDVTNLMVAHKATANSSVITATSPSISIGTKGLWSVLTTSGIATSGIATLNVPAGSSATLLFRVDPITIAGALQYSKNSGTWTNFVTGTTLSVANGDTLRLRCSGMTQGMISGAVLDNGTQQVVDEFRFTANVVLTSGSGTSIAPCTVAPTDPWTQEATGATVTSAVGTITVPSGNSGQLKLKKDTTTSSGVVKYSKNGGGYTTFADGDIVTFANNDTITFQGTSLATNDVLSGRVLDVDSGNTLMAYYSLNRVTTVHDPGF